MPVYTKVLAAAGPGFRKVCNGIQGGRRCGASNRSHSRVCYACRKPLRQRPRRRVKPTLDDAIRSADVKAADWLKKLNAAMTRWQHWTHRGQHLRQRQLTDAQQRRADTTGERPSARALRFRKED